MATDNRRDEPPDPFGAGTVEELTARLRALRTWAGTSYRSVHRDVVRLRAARGIPERPVYNTVYRSFQAGRTRLDVELVVDIARVLLGDNAQAEQWRAVCQVVAGQADAAAIVDVSDRLPADLGLFSGRDRELRQLATATGSVAIEGMPGVGKTRLAVHAAHQIDAEIRLAVDLRGYDNKRPPADPAAVLDGFLRLLGVPGDQLQHLDLPGRIARYRQLLAGNRAVVLLDNAGTVEQVRPLVANVSSCLTLITSRRTLSGLPGASHLRLDVFTAEEALLMLRDVARGDAATAADIAELLGRLPLALAVTAARIRANPDWTLADHRERLVRHREVLRLDDGVDLSVALSYRDLAAAERRAFRLLSLHPGGDIERYAAAALVDVDLPTMERHLGQLQTANLLQQKTAGRYVFHDLIRLYAADRAADEEAVSARRAALTRLFDHYEYAVSQAMDHYAPHQKHLRPEIRPAETAVPEFDDRDSATAWLEAEHHNLIATAQYATDNGWPFYASHQSDMLTHYLDTAARHNEAAILHTLALKTTDEAGRVRAACSLGYTYVRTGRHDEALALLQGVLPRARQLGDRQTVRRLLNHLGLVLVLLGRSAEALAYYEESLRICRALEDRVGEVAGLTNLGILFESLGRYHESLDCDQRALIIARQLGERLYEGRILGNIGFIYMRLQRNSEALIHYQESLDIAREMGDPVTIAVALDNMGMVHTRASNYREAEAHHLQALDIAHEIGHREVESAALMNLGVVYSRLGRHADAMEHHQQALAIAQDTGLAQIECETFNNIGETLLAMGLYVEALDSYHQALELAKTVGGTPVEAQAHDGIAQAAFALNDRESARSHWEEALRLYTDIGVGANAIQDRLSGIDATIDPATP
jgi:tetratricopeptide (TPR) repeat protein